MKKLIGLIVILAIAAGITWYGAGREPGPRIVINSPQRVIGHHSELAVTVDTPGAKLTHLQVTFEQGKTRVPLFRLQQVGAAQLKPAGPNQLVLRRPIDKATVPHLVQGEAKIVVTATRPVLFGYQWTTSTVTHAVKVDLTPPTLSVVSRHVYVAQGGAALVVYRVSPANVQSGVRVGRYTYPGYPASGAHIKTRDPGLRVAFFALEWNQSANTPISLYARDAAGNSATSTFAYDVIPKHYPKSTIRISNRFLKRVVPPILANAPGFKVPDPSNLVDAFVRVDHDLGLKDDAEIAALARKTSPVILWHGAWEQQPDSAVEATYAEQRTFVHDGKVIGHEVHLGYDLASVAGAPVTAENSGRVVFAGWLDIYGNCVVIDHGMGVQSLYGHMSSIKVHVGERVRKGQALGREGETGLAAGPHVHFAMLVNGHFVTPLDWWDPHWIRGRIVSKLIAAGAPAADFATADAKG